MTVHLKIPPHPSLFPETKINPACVKVNIHANIIFQ